MLIHYQSSIQNSKVYNRDMAGCTKLAQHIHLKRVESTFFQKPPHLLLCWNTHPCDAGDFFHCPSACSHLGEHTNYVLWDVFTSLKTEEQLETKIVSHI
jgi:hypothetical protein